MEIPLQIGLIGCGNISNAYFKWCGQYQNLKIKACADLNPATAKAKAVEFGLEHSCTTEELLSDPEIKLILNLTIPQAHASVNQACLLAGKHVYVEKPFGTNLEEASHVLDLARKMGLRVGAAPDTFLGGGLQTCRRLVDAGCIGRPLSAVAFMAGQGHEGWHPNPAFYYAKGGGPLLDMGPYYLTALISILGPIRRVCASAATAFQERKATSPKFIGTNPVLPVEIPTHLSGVLDFIDGTMATVIMSFDVFGGHHLPRLEIYGEEGTLCLPDPNTFGGPVYLRRKGSRDFVEIPLSHSDQVGRGLGASDMVYSLQENRPHRASGEMAFHVLEVMCAFEKSSLSGTHQQILSTCERPAPLPALSSTTD